MNENSDLLPNLLHEEFEMQMRGYSRRQVDDFVARRNNEIRELEQRLARTLDDSEHLRRELSTVRQQALSGRPAHEEVSERISQILKLADDEARAQKNKADDDIGKQRADAQQESERVRAEAREQAERMLTAAQEQAERTISASRTEADKTRTAAKTEADRLTSDTRKKADAALAQAKGQAKKVLDEATARATAIHDGAERRLNLLSTRHAETVRRLTDILDGVQGLVAAEAARMSLEEEVNQSVSRAVSLAEAEDAANAGGRRRQAGRRHGPGACSRRPPRRPSPQARRHRSGAMTIASPSPGGRDLAGGRECTRLRNPAFDPFEGPVPVGGGMAAPGGRGPAGRQGTPPPPPSLADRASRFGAPQDGPPRSSLPMPSGAPVTGLGDPLADREAKREAKREQPNRTGLIDPDEPTEGIRML